jgi:hypothetical protein
VGKRKSGEEERKEREKRPTDMWVYLEPKQGILLLDWYYSKARKAKKLLDC